MNDKPLIGLASKEYIRQRSIDIAAGRFIPNKRDPKVWLIYEDETDNPIYLSSEEIEVFRVMCNEVRPLSPRMIEAIKRLNEEGF